MWLIYIPRRLAPLICAHCPYIIPIQSTCEESQFVWIVIYGWHCWILPVNMQIWKTIILNDIHSRWCDGLVLEMQGSTVLAPWFLLMCSPTNFHVHNWLECEDAGTMNNLLSQCNLQVCCVIVFFYCALFCWGVWLVAGFCAAYA